MQLMKHLSWILIDRSPEGLKGIASSRFENRSFNQLSTVERLMLNMQGMCDANCSFIGVTIKHVETTHDNVAFTDSGLLEQVREIEFPYHLVPLVEGTSGVQIDLTLHRWVIIGA
jgi:hypothetical protein